LNWLDSSQFSTSWPIFHWVYWVHRDPPNPFLRAGIGHTLVIPTLFLLQYFNHWTGFKLKSVVFKFCKCEMDFMKKRDSIEARKTQFTSLKNIEDFLMQYTIWGIKHQIIYIIRWTQPPQIP
jgi:hypothetical protein